MTLQKTWKTKKETLQSTNQVHILSLVSSETGLVEHKEDGRSWNALLV